MNLQIVYQQIIIVGVVIGLFLSLSSCSEPEEICLSCQTLYEQLDQAQLAGDEGEIQRIENELNEMGCFGQEQSQITKCLTPAEINEAKENGTSIEIQNYTDVFIYPQDNQDPNCENNNSINVYTNAFEELFTDTNVDPLCNDFNTLQINIVDENGSSCSDVKVCYPDLLMPVTQGVYYDVGVFEFSWVTDSLLEIRNIAKGEGRLIPEANGDAPIYKYAFSLTDSTYSYNRNGLRVIIAEREANTNDINSTSTYIFNP